MNKFNVLELIFLFYSQRNEHLSNVKYTIVFTKKNGTKETYKNSTDQNGKTKPIRIDTNGKLQVFVEGYSSIFSKKTLISPILAEGSNNFEINEAKLEENLKFPTAEQYKAMQLNAQQKLEHLKKTAQKNTNKGSKIFGNLGQNAQPFPIFGNKKTPSNGVGNILNSSLFNMSYEEYKKQHTVSFKQQKYLKFKNYCIYQFLFSNGKSIPNFNYQIFAKTQEKPVVNMRPSPTDFKGFTQVAYTYEDNYVQYSMAGKPIKSALHKPITCVDDQIVFQIIIPTSGGITNPNVNNKIGMGPLKKPPIVINPYTNEVVVLPPSLYEDFYNKTKILSDAVEKVHQTNASLRRAIQAKNIDDIREMEKRLNINQQEALSKINGEFQQRTDLQEVWIASKEIDKGQSKTNLLRRYLKPAAYEKLKNSRLNEDIRVEITNAENANRVADPYKIKKSFDEISKKILNAKGEVGSEEKAVYNLIGGLGGEISEQYTTSRGIDVSQEAQWMRMVAGAHGEGEISASSAGVQMKLNANASAKWTLFEGKKEWRYFFPSENGWYLEHGNYHLGEIRFLIGCEISGFSGANLGISGNLSVDITHQGTKQLITAVKRDPQRSMANMIDKAKGAKFNAAEGNLELMEELGEKGSNQAQAQIKAFAGVELQGVLKGGIEWFDPGTSEDSKAKFVTIASASAGGGVSAGVGAEGQFQIGYSAASNTFRVLVAAHLCWGIGAKGTAAFDVGADQLINFAGFIKSQVAYAGFKTLAYVNEQAFLRLSQILAVCIGQDQPLTTHVLILSRVYRIWINNLDKDQGRLLTARRVNSNLGRKELLDATPETKGILLYAVSHWTHQTAPILDISISLSWSEVDIKFFPERKTAITNILATCTSEAEWKNTIQHIHPEGTKLTDQQVGKVEGDLIRFLNYDILETKSTSEKRLKTLLNCLNTDQDYGGDDLNHWLKLYLEYRKGARTVKNHMNYMIVRNQHDPRFRELQLQQNLPGALGAQDGVLMASNLEILAPFEPQNPVTNDHEYKV
ncbi:hypothetical protein [Acinetobacter bereziniae]|uniref:hypothetical protein n=1 Tax=Acinetobacter bereziniae TaxID=106648 RepID=UPI000C2C89D8|nr:hypothetical protein [Acinetobacter bereziniae]ATZ64794.1 hypothetical protein BSR55_16315 [Acinetobacter bereziniae]